jgi:hypothetical protein
MNTTRRDGRDDTGENDVQELRRRHAGNDPLPTYEPFVRHREDVPHEDALPDFYGLEDDGIDAELSELVDAGELCMGVDPQTGEVVYWFPEADAEEPEQPKPAPRHSRRARKPRKRSTLYRRTMLTVIASVAPFFVGMSAEAALDMHADRNHPMDQPDMAGAEVPTPPAPAKAVAHSNTLDTYRPTGYSYESAAGNAEVTTSPTAKVPASPTAEKPGSYVGKHRKGLGRHIAAREKASRKTESETPRRSRSDDSEPPVASHTQSKRDPNTPAEIVVNGILGDVGSLLG